MTITQGLEGGIIGVGRNVMLLDGIVGAVDVKYTIKSDIDEVFEFCYEPVDSTLRLNIEEIVKLVADNKTDYCDPFTYEQDVLYTEKDHYHYVKLCIDIENDGNKTTVDDIAIIYAALQVGECIGWGALLGQPITSRLTTKGGEIVQKESSVFPLTFPFCLGGQQQLSNTGKGGTQAQASQFPISFPIILGGEPVQSLTSRYPLKNPATNGDVVTLPIFLGYPHTTTLLEENGLKRVLDHDGDQILDFQYVPEVITDHCGGVYVKWLGRYGNYMYWLFEGTYEESINVRSLGDIQNLWTDRATATSNTINIGKEARTRLSVSTKAHKKYMRLIKQILSSPEVYIYENDCFGVEKCTWTKATIANGNYPVQNSKFNTQDLRITLSLPEMNVQKLI